MPANTSPIFSRIGSAQWVNGLTAANTTKDGTGTVATIFTADAANGSYIHKLVIRPRGTNVATVLRIFLNNGATNTDANNNALFAEIGMVATTNSETVAQPGVEFPLNIALPPGYRVMATLGTAVAGGFAVTAICGDY